MIRYKISTEKIEGRQFILTQICFQWTCVISVFVTSYKCIYWKFNQETKTMYLKV